MVWSLGLQSHLTSRPFTHRPPAVGERRLTAVICGPVQPCPNAQCRWHGRSSTRMMGILTVTLDSARHGPTDDRPVRFWPPEPGSAESSRGTVSGFPAARLWEPCPRIRRVPRDCFRPPWGQAAREPGSDRSIREPGSHGAKEQGSQQCRDPGSQAQIARRAPITYKAQDQRKS